MEYAWRVERAIGQGMWVEAHEELVRILTRLDRLIEDWVPCTNATPQIAEAHACTYTAYKNARKVIKVLSPLVWDKINETEWERAGKAKGVQA